MLLCEPHRERGLSVPADKTVAGTPMCEACFAGRPISDEVDELDDLEEVLDTLLKTACPASRAYGPRRAYGIRTASSAEQIRRRQERVRTIRPRTSWRRGKRELKLPASPTSPTLSISPRQSEILSLLTKGLGNKEIAAALGLCERAVKFHLSNLYKKSATRDRTNLVLWHLRKTGALAPAPENALVQISPVGIEAWREETSA